MNRPVTRSQGRKLRETEARRNAIGRSKMRVIQVLRNAKIKKVIKPEETEVNIPDGQISNFPTAVVNWVQSVEEENKFEEEEFSRVWKYVMRRRDTDNTSEETWNE